MLGICGKSLKVLVTSIIEFEAFHSFGIFWNDTGKVKVLQRRYELG